jgi:hypothetical protein
MNRKDFFKKLGLGAMAIVVAPKVLADNSPYESKYIVGCDPISENDSCMGFIVSSRGYTKEWRHYKIGDITFYSKSQ